MRRQRTNRSRLGFTLIEVLAAVSIIGLAIVALLGTVAAGTRSNAAGRDLTTAVFLAQEVREWTLRLPFKDPDSADQGNPPGHDGNVPTSYVDDLDDLMTVTYSPPVDGASPIRGEPLRLSNLPNWSQVISLTWRDPKNLTTTVTPGTSDVIHVHVDVKQGGQIVYSTGWLVFRRDI